MLRTTMRAAFFAATLLVLTSLADTKQARGADLFYNFYVGPPGVPAQLYVSPRPTPPMVGHTWITYQPLMPHEFLYHHHRRYYRYYDGGYTKTTVRWY